MLRWQFTDSAE